jgi:dihydroorotate dehydrogenase
VTDLAAGLGLDGLVVSNTTLRHDLLSGPAPIAGGVSGAPLGPRALELVRRVFRRTGGRLPVVGVGGISSAEDAYRRIRAGASLVQVYSALVYEGPAVVARIVDGLGARLRADGHRDLRSVVGVDA